MLERLLEYLFWAGLLGVLAFGGALAFWSYHGVSMAEMRWTVIGLVFSMICGVIIDIYDGIARVKDFLFPDQE